MRRHGSRGVGCSASGEGLPKASDKGLSQVSGERQGPAEGERRVVPVARSGRKAVGKAVGLRVRLAPLALGAVGLLIIAGLALSILDLTPGDAAPWALYVLLLVPAGLLVVMGAALAIDPRPLAARRALAGAALLWLQFLAAAALLRAVDGRIDANVAILVVLAAVDGGALLALAATTPEVTSERLPGPLGRLGATVLFTVAILAAAILIIVVASVGIALWNAVLTGTLSSRLPWGAVVLVLLLPIATFGIAALGSRRAGGRSFRAQQAANRRNSLLLLVTLVGVVAGTAEIITAALTFSPVPALWAAGIATLVGLGAAVGADRFGANVVLETAGARPADPGRDTVLMDVVGEIALAANIPPPRVFVIEDGSANAFATGRDPAHATIAVTRGLLDRMDREELQGIVAHEMGHVRNLDTRYALYVAVLVGLVALVTDGFLRVIVETWRQGGFIWTGGDDAKETIAAFVSGILVGLFLLAVAAILRIAAPLFSLLVQAAVSREREFLADATSVELTRNPVGLERALAEIAGDGGELKAANRGTQHLWFRNPIKAGSDRRPGIFSTHPSIGARIERLRLTRGLEAVDPMLTALEDET